MGCALFSHYMERCWGTFELKLLKIISSMLTPPMISWGPVPINRPLDEDLSVWGDPRNTCTGLEE